MTKARITLETADERVRVVELEAGQRTTLDCGCDVLVRPEFTGVEVRQCQAHIHVRISRPQE
ncbi:MAG: hypothetical protein U1B94_09565 [candidate division NC10 bacterium]|nr:hypothetical protein [candidate division NC10 bacterium]